MIKSQAQTNFVKCINETKKSLDTQHISTLASRAYHITEPSFSPGPPLPRSSEPEYNSANEQLQSSLNLEGLIQSRNFTLKVVGLRKHSEDNDNSLSTLDLRLKADVSLTEIKAAIKDAGVSMTTLTMFFFSTFEAGVLLGFESPTYLYEEPQLRISVTEGDSVYDATIPGGLQVNK